ncbi:MAG: HAD family hydrolase [Thermodesulfobacteriota bacterium]
MRETAFEGPLLGGDMAALVLFDIDGTLIDTQGAGVRALARAVETFGGDHIDLRALDMAGRTDLSIMREVLAMNSMSSEDGHVGSLAELYLGYLKEEVAARPGRVMPGVRELLSALSREKGIHLGLLTGNLEQGAKLKLSAHGLDVFFSVGAFGDEHEDRGELVPLAIESLFRIKGMWVSSRQCVIVGDTPRDVDCAKRNGSPCIGVATGKHSQQDLCASGAQLVIPDLSATREIVSWILRVRDGVGPGTARQ